MKRRAFIQNTSLAGVGLALGSQANASNAIEEKQKTKNPSTIPLAVATWNVPNAIKTAWETLSANGNALDAVEKGVMVEEADENNQTVGKGGRPDRDGNVSLDACIMDQKGNCGSVVYLQNITHAVSVARKVMEETPHVMLAGKGAELFAVEKGFKRENLLTEASKKAWENWKKEAKYQPIINIENHDTIGMLTIDKNGDICGACTTSGMAFKMAGRVGDSPIIGSGLFVDNEVGAATATGMGEEVVKTVGSFLIVELMRNGKSPQEACEEAVYRIVKKNPNYKNFQVGFIAVNKVGVVGAYAIQKGFSYCLATENGIVNIESNYYHQG